QYFQQLLDRDAAIARDDHIVIGLLLETALEPRLEVVKPGICPTVDGVSPLANFEHDVPRFVDVGQLLLHGGRQLQIERLQNRSHGQREQYKQDKHDIE